MSSVIAHMPQENLEYLHQEWSPSWDINSLSPERIGTLVSALIPDDDIRAGRAQGVHIINGDEPASDIGRYIEWTRFEEKFGNDLSKMSELYKPYDMASTFLTVIDYEAKKPVGVIRIVKPIGESLITLEEIVKEGSPWRREGDSVASRKDEMGYVAGHTVDITTMGVMPGYTSRHSVDGASAVLYSTCVRWSLANGYNHWATIVDKSIYEMMQAWGEPFSPFEGTDYAPFEGSKASIPVYTELYSALENVRAFDQGIYDLYTKSTGLDAQYVLPQIG